LVVFIGIVIIVMGTILFLCIERVLFSSLSNNDSKELHTNSHTTILTTIKNENKNDKVKDFVNNPTNNSHIDALDSIINREIPEGYEEI